MPSKSETQPIHFILALLFSTVVLGLSSQNRLNWLINPVNAIFSPLRQPFFTLNQNFSEAIDQIKQLPHQTRLIRDLRRQNASLSVTAIKVKELEAENLALKKILDSPTLKQRAVVPAKVIGISRYGYLNQGSAQNLKEGLAVVSENTLIGVIVSTTTSTSKVRLLLDPDLRIPAISLSGSIGQILLNETTLTMTEVLQKDPLSPQEPVFTKGSDLIPSGLLIGHVEQINENPASVYKTAHIKPAISPTDEAMVFVILE